MGPGVRVCTAPLKEQTSAAATTSHGSVACIFSSRGSNSLASVSTCIHVHITPPHTQLEIIIKNLENRDAVDTWYLFLALMSNLTSPCTVLFYLKLTESKLLKRSCSASYNLFLPHTLLGMGDEKQTSAAMSLKLGRQQLSDRGAWFQ